MIAPIEIENKEFKKVLRGYKEEEVDEFLDLVKEDYEQLYRENAELKEKVRLYQDQINKYENIEETLNSAMLNFFFGKNEKSKLFKKDMEMLSESKTTWKPHCRDSTFIYY